MTLAHPEPSVPTQTLIHCLSPSQPPAIPVLLMQATIGDMGWAQEPSCSTLLDRQRERGSRFTKALTRALILQGAVLLIRQTSVLLLSSNVTFSWEGA